MTTDIREDGYQREKESLVQGDVYRGAIFDAVVLPAGFDAMSSDEIADYLIQLAVRARTGALHGYKKRLYEDLYDTSWVDADAMTAKKGVRVKHKRTGRRGRIVGARAANAIFVKWDGDTSGGMGMGDRVHYSDLKIHVG